MSIKDFSIRELMSEIATRKDVKSVTVVFDTDTLTVYTSPWKEKDKPHDD